MTLLGLDFDNTLVRYDRLFHQLAVEKGLIRSTFPADKLTIRNYLRDQGKDQEFTLMQGEVYGSRILEAEPAEDMLNTLSILNSQGIRMVLISHKTKYPYIGKKYDLHQSALAWLEKYGFFRSDGLAWKSGQIVFAESKIKKIKAIKDLNCTHYVDDLEEILSMLDNTTKKILYTQEVQRRHSDSDIIIMNKWSDLIKLIN